MKYFRDNPLLRMLGIATLVFSVLLISGCGGCRDDAEKDETAEKEKEKKKKKKKPDFDTRTPVLLPGLFPNPEDEVESKTDDTGLAMMGLDNPAFRFNRTKLGHWVTANFQVIANQYNSDGQLAAYSMNSAGQPVGIPSTDYYLTTTRPVSLAKGEWKNLETTVFLPRRKGKTSIANINYALERSVGGLKQIMLSQPTTLMKPFQHHVVVLSNRPDSYAYLKMTDVVQLRGQQLGNGALVPPFYYVVPSVPGTPNPLPSNSLTWTSIAYLVWDDYDPEKLSQEQKDALLDWIHFGGQLILSGPDCLDKLQFSFLGSYLPAQFGGSRNLSKDDLKELNEKWTVPDSKKGEKKIFQISDRVPLLGASFTPHEDAKFIDGTGELAVERQLGRGRIVATAFSLGAPAVRKWRSYPSFLHNALLRKPARKFGRTQDMDISYRWIDSSASIFDPMLGTTLRYLSRDLSKSSSTPLNVFYAVADEPSNIPEFTSVESVPNEELLTQNEQERDKRDTWHFGGYSDSQQSGCGGWNDDSGVSTAARATLQEAAGISPPSSGFVLKMLIAYLAVLVPINWVIFRSLGRVEWAWVAAPIIAIIGAVVVVKMASLDIGFVRSNTQIGILEVYADYPRAHATEYSALYTSLSTRYNVDLDNSTAQSLPFAVTEANTFTQTEETISRVNLHRTVQNRLEGFQVPSNDTELLHTECMIDLDGVISCEFDDGDKPTTVSNGSFVALSNAGVVWRDQAGQFNLSWIGDLEAGAVSNPLVFASVDESKVSESWQNLPVFASTSRAANNLWNDHVGADVKSANLEKLASIPALKTDWDRFERQLVLISRTPPEETSSYSRKSFLTAYEAIRQESKVRIGRLFDAVANTLDLAPGECRMFASTDKRIGRNRFDPEATQTDSQTLIVVHLRMADLPPAKRDANSMTDFMTKSNLDW